MKAIRSCLLSVAGTVLTVEEKFLLEKTNPLGVTLFKRNIQSKEQLKTLIKTIKEVIGRDNVWIALDQEGGRVCRLASPDYRSYMSQSQMGKFQSPALRKKAIQLHVDLISDDLHGLGFNVNYAPVADVLGPKTTDALKSRCFSDDKRIVASCSKQMILDYIKRGICPCIKHLPGHGQADIDPHFNLPTIDMDLKKFEGDLYPFKKVAEIAPLGMTAHILLKGFDNQPATHSSKVIQQIIRNKIGFNGFLISDAIEMGALSGSLAQRTQKCLKAGCDAVCYCGGILEGNMEVSKAAFPLSDDALKRLKRIDEIITISPKKITNLSKKEEEYQRLMQCTENSKTDYDVVETLNKRKFK